MTRDQAVRWVEEIIFGGIAVTTAALAHASGGQDVTFAQWRAILRIGGEPDGCRVGEVAAYLHAGLPGTSRLLRRLERRGLLSLQRDEQDRRATRARLTETGAALRSSVLGYRRAEIAAILDEVRPTTDDERILRALAERFDARGNGDRPGSGHR